MVQKGDSRAFPRIQAEIPVEVVRNDRCGFEPFAATLVDISQNGALLVTQEAIPTGEWIIIRPARKGAGFGQDVTAIVERNLTPQQKQARLACRFPEPLDYSIMRLFT